MMEGKVASPGIADLVLELTQLSIDPGAGAPRAKARATLAYEPPPDADENRLKSPSFELTAPLGPIERGEIEWYLERYHIWPSSLFPPTARPGASPS